MNIFIYDGTFDGLMTTIYDIYYKKIQPDKIFKEKTIQQPNFIDKYYKITTSTENSEKVINSINDKICEQALGNIICAFMCETTDVEIYIYNYIKLGFKKGRNIIQMLTDNDVLKINDLVRKIKVEINRFLGLVRFKKLEDDIYYSEINPKYNILSFIAPHFSRRMADQNWIIHDINRSLAIIYNCNDLEWLITEINLNSKPELDENENYYQYLWKSFFTSIGIQERKNPRLQMHFVPKRYWKYLTEFGS